MTKPIAATLTLLSTLALVPSGHAADGDPRAEARDLFEQRRELESESHLERIRILQDAEACIQAAGDFRAYRDCERKEAEVRRDLRDRQKPQIRTLRKRLREFRAQVADLRGRSVPEIR